MPCEICDFCGNRYETRASGKGGRPSYYCSDACGSTKRFWDAFIRGLDKIKMAPEARKMLRREVMRVVNINLHDNRKRTETPGPTKNGKN